MTIETIQWVIRILLAAAFILMGILHFAPGPARTMAAMIPAPLRFRRPFDPRFLVAFTGVCEIAGGVGLLLPALHTLAGILLCVFLVAVFPANAYAARRPEKFGKMATPFVPRLIGQIVFIALCAFAAWPL
jgi:uncharacterized membrane protein